MGTRRGRLTAVVGAVLIVIALLLIPVFVLMTGAVIAAVMGWRLQVDADERHAAS